VELGPALVAKESKIEEQLYNNDFHKNMCLLQSYAADVAWAFNSELLEHNNGDTLLPAYVSFLDTCIYEVMDLSYAAKKAWILTEKWLEGEFTKWNSNDGKVLPRHCASTAGSAKKSKPLNAIMEGSEREEEEGEGEFAMFPLWDTFYDIPQTLSHFSYTHSGGDYLLCDLQGIWNEYDGFEFTDPCIHTAGEAHANGPTDKGNSGIDLFFKSHVCTELCYLLELPSYRTITKKRKEEKGKQRKYENLVKCREDAQKCKEDARAKKTKTKKESKFSLRV
jgi:hypothetical protein